MKLYKLLLLYFALVITAALSSCSSSPSPTYSDDADLECCDEDWDYYDSVFIRRVDTVYQKVEEVKLSQLYIQLGAFVNKSNAEQVASDARERLGTTVFIRLFDDGWYRVLIGEFEDLDKAKSVLQSVRSRGFFDAFIRDQYGPVDENKK